MLTFADTSDRAYDDIAFAQRLAAEASNWTRHDYNNGMLARAGRGQDEDYARYAWIREAMKVEV